MAREKLLVEEKSEELLAEVTRLLRKVRYACKASRDLENSTDSVYLNVGEGVAAFPAKMKASKYGIARGEAKKFKKLCAPW